MQHVITYIQEAVEKQEVNIELSHTMGELLTGLHDITKAAKWHGHGDTLQRWIGSMLGGRKITATLAGETL